MQVLHLGFKYIVEGTAQHAAEFGMRFGKPADPEIDGIESTQIPCVNTRTIKECEAISFIQVRKSNTVSLCTEGEFLCCRTFASNGCRCDNGLMCAVSRDEVDNRELVFDVQGKINPTGVGLEVS